MKTMKKLVSLIMALAMVMALAVSASAAEEKGTITITPPNDTQENVENTYKAYKIFEATYSGAGTSYKPLYNNLPTGFELDAGGNVIYTANKDKTENFVTQLTDADIAALAAYVTTNSITAIEIKTTGSAPTSKEVDYGYYYITTSTGTAVTVSSANPDAPVNDKNTVPTISKTVNGQEKVIIEAGQTITFTVEITVGRGAKNYKLVDTMGTGLEFVTGSMKVGGTTVTPDVDGQTITYAIPDTSLPAEGEKITITYDAKVTSDTLSAAAAKNSAKVTYGEGNNPTPTDEVEVYNAKITVTKVDGNGDALAGAGFVLRNDTQGDANNGKYYTISGSDVDWVDSIADDRLTLTTATANVVTFTGLPAGTYTLIEQVVPNGYNKAADKTITVEANNFENTTYTEEVNGVVTTTTMKNLEQEFEIVNNAGLELPETGGIGTTIFTVAGSVLMIGAAILYITKKRSEDCAN